MYYYYLFSASLAKSESAHLSPSLHTEHIPQYKDSDILDS